MVKPLWQGHQPVLLGYHRSSGSVKQEIHISRCACCHQHWTACMLFHVVLKCDSKLSCVLSVIIDINICSYAEHADLHSLPENAAYEGLPTVQTALRLKHVHKLALAYAAVGGSCFCRFLCPNSCCHAAITPENKPLQKSKQGVKPFRLLIYESQGSSCNCKDDEAQPTDHCESVDAHSTCCIWID